MRELTRSIDARLSEDEYDHLSEIAEKMGCTISHAVRLIIKEAIVITKTEYIAVINSKISLRTIVK